MRIPSGEISIHFQFISSGINRISADIISISAYRKAFYAYIMAAGLHKKCKKHIPPIKEKGNKKNAPRSWVRPLFILCPLFK